jgi:hypothetical protein
MSSYLTCSTEIQRNWWAKRPSWSACRDFNKTLLSRIYLNCSITLTTIRRTWSLRSSSLMPSTSFQQDLDSPVSLKWTSHYLRPERAHPTIKLSWTPWRKCPNPLSRSNLKWDRSFSF